MPRYHWSPFVKKFVPPAFQTMRRATAILVVQWSILVCGEAAFAQSAKTSLDVLLDQLAEQGRTDARDAIRRERQRALDAQDAGRVRDAIAAWQDVVRREEAVHGEQHEAVALHLNHLGELHRQVGDHERALSYFMRSQSLVERYVGAESHVYAIGLNNLALLYDDMGRYSNELQLCTRSLRILEALYGRDSPASGQSLNCMARAFARLTLFDRSIATSRRLVLVLEKAQAPPSRNLASEYNNLAHTMALSGDMDGAILWYERALTVQQSLPGAEEEDLAKILGNLAGAYRAVGEFSKAFPLIRRSIALLEASGEGASASVASALVSLARLYLSVGDAASARPVLERALKLVRQRESIDKYRLIDALRSYAQCLERLGERSGAWAAWREIVDVVATVPYPSADSRSIMRMADLVRFDTAAAAARMGRPEIAAGWLESLRARLERPGVREPALLAQTLIDLGHLRVAAGEIEDAMAAFQRAMTLIPPGMAYQRMRGQLYAGLFRAYSRMNQRELAIVWGKEAVNVVQSARGQLTGELAAWDSSFLARNSAIYRMLADQLVRSGRIPEAQQVLQMLKERELFESSDRSQAVDVRATRAPLTGLEAASFEPFYVLRARQVSIATERQTLENERLVRDLLPIEKRRLDEIDRQQLPILEQAMKKFITELSLRVANSGSTTASVNFSQTLLAAAVQKLAVSEHDAHAVGLQYFVADNTLTVILTVPGGPPVARQQGLSGGELNDLITRFSTQLGKRADPDLVRKTSQALYRILIAPIRADLEAAGARTLMFSPTDVLRYVPFAALHDGKRYLVEDYALSTFNEAAGQALDKSPERAWRVAGMGMSESVDGLPALASVHDEIRNIVSERGDAYLDARFSRAALSSVLTANYNVLHLASHFVFRPGRPEASWLYLGDKSRLTLADIAREKLDFQRFELVTLSACETGQGGGRDATGSEVESLGARAQIQGAGAVMATLWKVADASTSAMMQRFYLRSDGGQTLNKAQALRNAQLSMLRGDARWQHPYYWAPFVLMGNWR